jgi:nitrate/nitrite transporter NarK
MFLKRSLRILILVTIFYLASPSPTYAYLDPGTGSFIFQLIIAGLAGAAFAVKMYWSKIKAFFEHEDATDSTQEKEETNA